MFSHHRTRGPNPSHRQWEKKSPSHSCKTVCDAAHPNIITGSHCLQMKEKQLWHPSLVTDGGHMHGEVIPWAVIPMNIYTCIFLHMHAVEVLLHEHSFSTGGRRVVRGFSLMVEFSCWGIKSLPLLLFFAHFLTQALTQWQLPSMRLSGNQEQNKVRVVIDCGVWCDCGSRASRFRGQLYVFEYKLASWIQAHCKIKPNTSKRITKMSHWKGILYTVLSRP